MRDRDESTLPGDAASTGSGRDWLSMSTDNTPAGIDSDLAAGPISLVQEGMRVVDSANDEIGKVSEVRMGDADAVTDHEPRLTEGETVIDEIGRAIFGAGSELPSSTRATLVRLGFVRIDGRAWSFQKDRYASAEQIGRIDGDVVHLLVAKDALPEA